jgi:hypothetical protein
METFVQIVTVISGVVSRIFRDLFTRFFSGFITAFDYNQIPPLRQHSSQNDGVCQLIIECGKRNCGFRYSTFFFICSEEGRSRASKFDGTEI